MTNDTGATGRPAEPSADRPSENDGGWPPGGGVDTPGTQPEDVPGRAGHFTDNSAEMDIGFQAGNFPQTGSGYHAEAPELVAPRHFPEDATAGAGQFAASAPQPGDGDGAGQVPPVVLLPAPHQVPPPPATRARSRRGRWVAAVAALVAVVVTAGAVAWAADSYLAGAAALHKVDHRKAHRANIQKMLDARAAALLAGEESGWLAAVDPGDKKLVAEQRRTFRLLRDMDVERYEYELLGTIGLPGDSIQLSATVSVRYCFGVETCRPAASEALLWFRTEGNRLLVTRYKPQGKVRPWEVSDLRVVRGSRVVVAALPKYAKLLDKFRYEADRAAREANRFGPQDGTLGKHLVFLGSAGGSAGRWYGGSLGRAAMGWAFVMPADADNRVPAVEHAIRADKVKNGRVGSMMAWHLGYGAASSGALDDDGGSTWALRDGIATYLGQDKDDPARYVIEKDLRTVLKRWNGSLDELYPESKGYTAWQTAAWVAVYRLIDKYGEKKFIAFYDAVARQGVEYGDAAKKHLGRSLKAVESDVRKYMRRLS